MTNGRTRSGRRGARSFALAAAFLAAAACGGAPNHAATAAAGDVTRGDTVPRDSAFQALQARGADARGMGVDQYTSVHHFDALPDGGRIELQRATDDSAGIAQIRRHLHAIATAFATGDFSTPAFVHMTTVPGTQVMAARRKYITYTEHDLPRGGEVRITTHDSAALAAIRDFMAYQRSEHHAGGMTGMHDMPGMSSAVSHSAQTTKRHD